MSREAWGDPPDRQEPPQQCPVCGGQWHAEGCELGEEVSRRLKAEDEVAKLRKDAERLNWLRDKLFEHKWNGVVGKGCAVQWQVAGDFRFTQRELTDDSGIAGGDFRRAIDRAMASK